MLLRSGRNAHRYIQFKDNRITCYQTHEKDRPGIISGLSSCWILSVVGQVVIVIGVLIGVFAGGVSWAELPTGYSTASGSATFQNDGTTLNIHASNGAIINYQSFNIGAHNAVNIYSPLTLNRVTGGSPSQILGQLNSTGKVFLINPSGIIFGNGASVNVQSLVASTLSISNDNFLAGKYTFQSSPDSPAGAIVNHGKINATDSVAMMGGAIDNTGTIQAPQVQIAVGDQITYQVAPGVGIDVTVDKSLQQKVAGYQAAIHNSGTIAGEQVKLQAQLARSFYDTTVNNEGIVKADGFALGADGQIVAIGQTDDHTAVVQNSGSLIANGTADHVNGGSIHVEGDTTINSGLMQATGAMGGVGGEVQMLGDNVLNLSGSTIDVSGDLGGGTALIGGDYQGRLPLVVRNAKFNFSDADTHVLANANTLGNGGKVIYWGDNKTIFQGQVEAKGGAQGGNGGFVETSGKNILQATGSVNALAQHGNAGQWLLDPNNITIQNGGSDTNLSSSGVNPLTLATTNDSAIVTSGTIQTALNNGTDVTIQTSLAGGNSQAGDITVAAGTTIAKTAGGDATLTLKANNSIIMNGNNGGGNAVSITSTSNKLGVVLNSDTDQSSDGGTGGAIQLNYTTINSNGGNITLGGGANASTTATLGTAGNLDGIQLAYSNLTAGAGNISLRGTGRSIGGTSDLFGVFLQQGSQISTTSGNIGIYGTGGTGANNNDGIKLDGNGSLSTISSQSGAITVNGHGGDGSTQDTNSGVNLVNGGQIVSTGSATINVTGTGGAATNSNMGIFVNGYGGSNTKISSVDGAITLTGQGGNGTNENNIGVKLGAGGIVSSTGNAPITINATGGTGTYTNMGLFVDGNGNTSQISTNNGNITITGLGANGSADSNDGVQLVNGGQITSSGNGTISVTGTGGNGTWTNYGVYVDGYGGTNTKISSVTGNVSVTGHGGMGSSNDNNGIYLTSNAQILSTGGANVTIAGTKGGGTSYSFKVNNSGSNILGSNTMTGNLSLVADDYNLNNLQLRSGGQVIFRSYDSTKSIGINGAAGAVQYDSSFLSLIDTGTVTPSRVVFGDSVSGSGAVSLANGCDISSYNYGFGLYGGNITVGSNVILGGKDFTLGALAGDINVNAGTLIGKSTGGDANLNLKATGSILFNGNGASPIYATSTSNKLNITLNADTDQGSDAGAGGAIALNYTGITSNGGNVTLGGGANPATTATLGTVANNMGVSIYNSFLEAGAGNIIIRGQARDNGAANGLYGVSFDSYGYARTTTGHITVNGRGGSGTTVDEGVILNNNALITSQDGAISVTGHGGDTTGNYNAGVLVFNGSQITSTGTATVNVSGTGGSGPGGGNDGVWIIGTNSAISSLDGDVTVTGHGGTSASNLNQGIHLSGGGQINSTGAAALTVSGTGGDGVTQNFGVFVEQAGSSINGHNGNVQVTGQGGTATGGYNDGVVMLTGGQITSGGSGTLTVAGTGGAGSDQIIGVFMSDANTKITSSSAAVTVTGQGGAGGVASSQNEGLYMAGAAQITSTGAATLTITGTGGTGGSNNYGVGLDGNNTKISTINGAVTVTGQGGTSAGNYNNGIVMTNSAQVASTGNGALNLSATGGTGNSNQAGLFMDGAALVTSSTGAVTITGQGGTGAVHSVENDGIYMANGSQVSSTGSATLNITGTGGSLGGSNYGFYVDGNGATNTKITSLDGNMTLTGNGGSGSDDNNHGLYILGGGQVSGTGASKLSLFGTEGTGSNSEAILLADNNIQISSNAAGNALVLSTTQNFINNTGASALSAPNGRWLVYSADPSTTVEGGLAYSKHYNDTYAGNAPGTIGGSDNMMLYSVAPTLTVTADNATRVAGSPNPAFTGTISGYIDGDTSANAYSGAPTYSTGANLASAAGNYPITSALGSLSSSFGYQFNFVPGSLTVTAAPVPAPAPAPSGGSSIPYLLNPVQNPNTVIFGPATLVTNIPQVQPMSSPGSNIIINASAQPSVNESSPSPQAKPAAESSVQSGSSQPAWASYSPTSGARPFIKSRGLPVPEFHKDATNSSKSLNTDRHPAGHGKPGHRRHHSK